MTRLITVPPINDGDIRALAEFLAADEVSTEAVFHKLLEEHPSLLGVLGYVRILSEFSVQKTPRADGLVTKPDRVDFLGARSSEVTQKILYVDVIELKRTQAGLAQRADKRRLSSGASGAITQLHSYERDLLESSTNRDALSAIDLAIGQPKKVLIMGREQEFSNDPDAYESIQAQFRQAGITHITGDELLRVADRALHERVGEIVTLFLPRIHLQLVRAGKKDFSVSQTADGIVAAPRARTVVPADVFEWREVKAGAMCPKCRMMSLDWYGEGGAALSGVWRCSRCGYENFVDDRSGDHWDDPHFHLIDF